MNHCLEHVFSFGRCGMYVSKDDIVFCSKRFLVWNLLFVFNISRI